MSEQPRNIFASLRWPVALAFAAAWIGPLVYYFVHTHFEVVWSTFWRIVLIQVGVLVLMCLLVAVSPLLHRLAFQHDVPQCHFRRRLLIGAGFYTLLGCIGLVVAIISA